jgi:hypothetical protein
VTPDEAVVAVVDALDAGGIRYMIVGSLASNFHGVPRSTRDADFVVELGAGGLDRLISALPASLSLRSQAAFEAVTGTTRYLVELAGSPFVCELFVLSSDPHDQERFARRLRVAALGRIIFLASAEDMVVTKLRWAVEANRAKDREDVRNILAVRGADLDWAYLRRWAAEHGTLELLEQIRASIVLPG